MIDNPIARFFVKLIIPFYGLYIEVLKAKDDRLSQKEVKLYFSDFRIATSQEDTRISNITRRII